MKYDFLNKEPFKWWNFEKLLNQQNFVLKKQYQIHYLFSTLNSKIKQALKKIGLRIRLNGFFH